MGCPVSIPHILATRNKFGTAAANGSDDELRKDSFIHEMLRPQLDPSVPPIGFGTPRHQRRRSTKAENSADWVKRRYSLRRQQEVRVLLPESSSVESALTRMMSLRDQIAQQSVAVQQAQTQQLQANVLPNPSPQPSITSAISTELSQSAQQNLQHICGTAVTFEWLFQRLVEKFKCPQEPEPQWIVEKMNDIGEWDLDRTTVLRVTFGWENPKLPRSVVLKICERHEDDPPEEAKLAAALFKRECLTYEWLASAKQKCQVAIPRIFVIKKQWSRSCNALLVMEDLSERAQIGELAGVPMEGVRDLLRALAQLHALSMVHADAWRAQLDGARLPAFLFDQMERFTRALTASSAANAKLMDMQSMRQLEPVLSKVSLELVVTQTCAELGLPECLVHGQPVARNVFFKTDGNGPGPTMVQALIDWTQAHAGCFGEDLAKCICWNLVGHERTGPAQLLKLLQYYHYQLLKKLQALGASADLQKGLTLDKVQAAYQRFVPSAAVTFLLFLPEELNHAEAALLERAQQLVDEAAQMVEEAKRDRRDRGGHVAKM